jgi:hypothetical protein
MSFITKIVISFIWLAAIFDPIGNVFAMRYIAMLLSILNLFLIPVFVNVRFFDLSWRGSFILVLSIIMPIHGSLLFLIYTRGGEFIDTSYLAAGVLILYSMLYYSSKITEFALKSMIWVLRTLVLIIFISAYLQFQNNYEIISFFTEKNVAIIGFREYGSVQFPYIYFLSSPLLIFLLAYDFDNIVNNLNFYNLIYFLCTSAALILSGTRAHMLLPLLIVPLYFFLKSSFVGKMKVTIFLICFFILLVSDETIFNLLGEFFSTNESSNKLKISLLSGYSEIFSNPITFLLGQGYNAHEWSSTLRTMIVMEDKASKTELTYIEIFRVYGIFFFMIFVTMLLFVLNKLRGLSSRYYWLYLSFLLFLINSAINPYLFSTNGMLPLGLVLACIYFGDRNNNFIRMNDSLEFLDTKQKQV